jgi:hypothetical protein
MSTRNLALLGLLTLLATLIFDQACRVLFVYAPPLVAAQDDTVGEMLLDEGLRFEANGAADAAAAKFRKAESARFQGTKNLRHLQYKLALLETDPAVRERYIREVIQDNALTEKDPALWLRSWEMLCGELESTQRWDDLGATLSDWDVRVNAANLYPSSHEAIRDAAMREYYRGVLARQRGDIATALDLFRKACADGVAPPRRALADLLEQTEGASREVITRLRAEADAAL